MTHAIIYDRASTNKQEDNWSRVNAKEVGIRIAEQNGFTWEYVKEIGSGTTLTGRPKMLAILDRIAAREVQVLIVQELDRLARPEEAVVYSTIRNTIMDYGVIIYTHTSRVDLNNDDDDFVADITMSVAKKERRRILKRVKRGKQARAESGRFTGGFAGLGYAAVGAGKNSDLIIDREGAKIVRLIFKILDDLGGNLWGTAKHLNSLGYTGFLGKPFTANTIRWIATRKLYIGIFETSFTEKVIHRPELQIISVDQFNRVQELIKLRGTIPGAKATVKKGGVRGRYIFTGFIVCGNCGGPMVAAKHRGKVSYQCVNYRTYGISACSPSKSYREHLILPPIVVFLAGFMFDQLAAFHAAINNAAAQYGKSITEEALEAAIQGELASVQAGKQRLVDAISLGVLTTEEAAEKLAELREHEQRLMVEIASVAKKAAIMAQWQQALETVKGKNKKEISDRLFYMAEHKTVAFRRLLSFVFKPNSIRVRTERLKGNQWSGVLEEYEIAETIHNSRNLLLSFETTGLERV